MVSRFSCALFLLLAASGAFACSACRSAVAAGIFDGTFLQQLLVMVLPVLAMVALALVLLRAGRARTEDRHGS